jgi:hypothetical protein
LTAGDGVQEFVHVVKLVSKIDGRNFALNVIRLKESGKGTT